MVKQWNQRVQSLRSRVNKYSRLRRLPALIGETNLNLVNNGYDKSNLSGAVTNPDAQRRLATAIQMDAFYNGFRSVYWLAGPQVQSAVNIWHNPGTPSRAALTVLAGPAGEHGHRRRAPPGRGARPAPSATPPALAHPVQGLLADVEDVERDRSAAPAPSCA